MFVIFPLSFHPLSPPILSVLSLPPTLASPSLSPLQHNSKAVDVRPCLPLLNDVLYESSFASQLWMLFNSNKQFLLAGDAYQKQVCVCMHACVCACVCAIISQCLCMCFAFLVSFCGSSTAVLCPIGEGRVYSKGSGEKALKLETVKERA